MATETSGKLKYLLTCTCGQTHPVDTSQAGQKISCAYGRTLEVPTLRGIRQLPQAEQPQRAAVATAPSWNRTQGLLFAGGLLITTICLAVVALLAVSRLQVDDRPPQVDIEREAAAFVEDLTPEQSWETWNEAREKGLGPYSTPQHVVLRGYRGELTIGIVIASVIGGAGIVAVVASLLLKR